jgi:hypothetical protein
MSALVSLCARMHARCNFTRRPSNHSFPDHPFVDLASGLVTAICLVLACLTTIIAIFLVLVRLDIFLGICLCLRLCLSSVRSGRALRSGIRLGEYHAISITLIVNDRHETKFPAGPSSAFGAVGELEGRRLRTCGLGILGDMSQHKDNRAQWTVCTASPLVTT